MGCVEIVAPRCGPMYVEPVLREKKMSTASLDLHRAESRDIDYLERARRLAPMLIDAADEIEEQRQLPERVVDALIEGGFFRLLLPRSLGGAEPQIVLSDHRDHAGKWPAESVVDDGDDQRSYQAPVAPH